MSEQPDAEDGFAMPEPDVSAITFRVLSVRMRDDARAQLDVLAQLNDRTVTEETRLALEHWVEQAKTDPTLKDKADRVRAEIDRDAENRRQSIERDAAARRNAIEAVLNNGETSTDESDEAAVTPEPTPKRGSATKKTEPNAA